MKRIKSPTPFVNHQDTKAQRLRSPRNWRLGVFVVTLYLLAFPHARAQEVTGTIDGTVKDPAGGLIPGAEVIALHASTGTTRKTLTGWSSQPDGAGDSDAGPDDSAVRAGGSVRDLPRSHPGHCLCRFARHTSVSPLQSEQPAAQHCGYRPAGPSQCPAALFRIRRYHAPSKFGIEHLPLPSEAFNAFNHVSFASFGRTLRTTSTGVNPNVDSFAVVTDTRDARVLQFALKLTF